MRTLVTLLLQRLRRDRLQLLIWIVGIALLALFSVSAVEKTYGDPAGRENILQLAVANPSILMLRGTPEGGGLDQFVFFEIFTFIVVLAGLMNTFLSVRHSRAAPPAARTAWRRLQSQPHTSSVGSVTPSAPLRLTTST
ncbi:hypothetical protein [Arthrobacter sp. 2MCAF14]|uniref:hypothetical protein n=1 Tax=Arthrobacter sp. 2MCAF14 TaxID=3232982 RepID=UPI003F8F576A